MLSANKKKSKSKQQQAGAAAAATSGSGTTCTASHGASVDAMGQSSATVKIALNFKRYVFDPNKRMIQ